jgi:hypothetical protein
MQTHRTLTEKLLLQEQILAQFRRELAEAMLRADYIQKNLSGHTHMDSRSFYEHTIDTRGIESHITSAGIHMIEIDFIQTARDIDMLLQTRLVSQTPAVVVGEIAKEKMALCTCQKLLKRLPEFSFSEKIGRAIEEEVHDIMRSNIRLREKAATEAYAYGARQRIDSYAYIEKMLDCIAHGTPLYDILSHALAFGVGQRFPYRKTA